DRVARSPGGAPSEAGSSPASRSSSSAARVRPERPIWRRSSAGARRRTACSPATRSTSSSRSRRSRSASSCCRMRPGRPPPGGLLFFVVVSQSHGVIALAWGLALNGGLALGVPLVALARRGLLAGGGHVPLAPLRRLWSLLQGAALPVAFQGFYLVALRLAAA